MSNKAKEIIIEGEKIVSDYCESKNVIKIYEQENCAIIYTKKGQPIYLRPSDIDDFIINSSWSYDYKDEEIYVIKNSGLVPKKEVRRYPRYAVTTITNKDIENKVNTYEFSREVKPFKGLLNEQEKGKVSLHRYVMGLYNSDKVNEYAKKFEISLEDIGTKLHVDHKEWDTRANFSDKLRVVTAQANSRNKSVSNKRMEWILPIEKSEGKFVMKVLDLNSISIPRNCKMIAEVIDLDDTGENVVQLKRWLLKELRKERTNHLKKFKGEVLSNDSLRISQKFNNENILKLINKAKELDADGKVIINIL